MIVTEILIVLLLIVVNGILAASELALVSSRKARLETMAEQGSRGARVALQLLADPGTFLSTVQIGITLVGIVAGAYSGATFGDALGDWLDGYAWISPNGDAIAITLAVIVITYLSLVVGELVPKRIALANPERLAAAVARPMRLLSRIAAPAVWLLRHSSDLILRLLRLSGVREATVTEDEVKSLIAEGTQSGIFEPEERGMIEGVLRLADRSVRAIMTPRAEISWIEVGTARDEILRRLHDERYTEILVCEGSIDHPLGVIDASDVIGALLDGGVAVRLADIVRKAPVIPEQTRILDLIEVFRKAHEHFAIIVDEYGTTQGIVTSTDILESIAGDLPDSTEDAAPLVVRREDGSWLVDGLLPIDEFEDLVGLRGLRGDFETVAGLVLDRLGRIPEAGNRIVVESLTIEVVDMDGRRIDKLLVTPAAGPPAETGDA